jgi:hypothetical protein
MRKYREADKDGRSKKKNKGLLIWEGTPHLLSAWALREPPHGVPQKKKKKKKKSASPWGRVVFQFFVSKEEYFLSSRKTGGGCLCRPKEGRKRIKSAKPTFRTAHKAPRPPKLELR